MLALSLVICSRNDNYSGNSLYRLQATLNYLALQVASLDRLDGVEVVVTDWGSETPLRQVLALTPDAARITHFLEVPRAIARDKQGDSPFAEVMANNAAIRRARSSLRLARESWEQGVTEELLAGDVRDAASALGEITGRTVSEEVLDRIFSQFCIGK